LGIGSWYFVFGLSVDAIAKILCLAEPAKAVGFTNAIFKNIQKH
jgi:hypothetical protein